MENKAKRTNPEGVSPSALGARALCFTLAACLAFSPIGCSSPAEPPTDEALLAFLDDRSGPPTPRPADEMMRLKADVIALPAISVTVWAIGALIVYIGSQAVFTNTIEDFEAVLGMALGQSVDWSWAEETGEPLEQADHLTESLNRIAYRSETSDFYSITGNDYLRFLTMTSPITVLDPQKLKDLMDGKVRPWGKYAKEFFAAIQVASMQARHLAVDDTGRGLCVRATVHSIADSPVPYVSMARATGAGDVIPAAVFASVKATIRCGMYDSNVREFIYSYYNVSGPRSIVADIFITHMLKTAKLIYKYVEVCQMPPNIQVDLDGGDCHDVTLH